MWTCIARVRMRPPIGLDFKSGSATFGQPMKSIPITLSLLLLLPVLHGEGEHPAVADKNAPSTQGQASPDGIGKFFHGREIAKVMGHPAIGWLERDEREREEAPTRVIEALALAPNAVIADIGAGSGYYSFRIAPKIPFGKVIAVDIQPEMLEYLEKKSAELKLTNVSPHLGVIDDIKLAAESIDAALMVDAYHEFSHPAEMLASLVKALKPGGKVFLVEYRAEDPEVPIKRLHKMSAAQAKLELESAGLRLSANQTWLPWQHFMIFEKPVQP